MRELKFRPSTPVRVTFGVLPAKVRVAPGLSLGSIYVTDDATNKVLVILKREFGPAETIEARTKAWLRSEGRLVEPAA